MKRYPAIATLEFRDIAVGMQTTDVMLKRAPVSVLKCGTISLGRYLALIGGSTASVEESYREGLRAGGASLVDHVFLPDIDENLLSGIFGRRSPTQGEAVGILETATVSSNFLATETALKTTSLTLVEIRYGDSLLGGKAISILHGPLHDIEAAVEMAFGRLAEKGVTLGRQIITQPDPALFEEVNTDTTFHGGDPLHIGGEEA